MSKLSSLTLFLSYGLIFLVITLLTKNFLDPDFGWHLRFGQMVLSSGFPKTDPFSYSMPSFPYVNMEWLGDILIALLNQFGRWAGLVLVTSALSLGALIIAIGKIKKSDMGISLILFFLGAANFAWFIAVRPVILTWLCFALLIAVVYDPKKWLRFRFLIPLFFLVWANLHAGFIAGLGVIFIKTLASFIERGRKEGLINAGVLIFSVLLTLGNPYGFNLWREIGYNLESSRMFETISEWVPAYKIFAPASAVLVPVAAAILFWFRKRLSWTHVGVFVLVLFLSAKGIRNIPLLTIALLPIIKIGWGISRQELLSRGADKKRLARAEKIALSILFLIALIQIQYLLYGKGNLSEGKSYPARAVTYLHANIPAGRIFSTYDWGGYLVWKLPEKKVFVDGRMPYWRQSPHPGESEDAFGEIIKLGEKKIKVDDFVKKYHISTVLWPRPETEVQLNFYEYVEKIFQVKKKASTLDLPKELSKLGWSKIYEDDVAVVYSREH